MKIKVQKKMLVVKKDFYETSVFFLLPLLLLPLINESHNRYVNLYVVIAVFYIWIYVKDIKNPVLLLNDNTLSFRCFCNYSYFYGFLTDEGMDHKLTKLAIKDISKIEFNYPVILVFKGDIDQCKIVLNVNEKDFIKISEIIELAMKEQKGSL